MKRRIAVCLVGFVICTITSGCTVLGGIVGSSSSKAIPVEEGLADLPTGTKIRLKHHNGRKTNGRFLAIEDHVDSACEIRYNATRRRSSPNVVLPPTDRNIIVRRIGSTTEENVRFLAFGGFGRTYMIVKSASGIREKMALDELNSVIIPGESEHSGLNYRRMSFRNELPICSHFVLETSNGIVNVPVNQVASVSKPAGGSGFLLGAAVGLGLDILIVAVLDTTLTSSSSCGLFGCGSF